jgi:cell division protein FtsL
MEVEALVGGVVMAVLVSIVTGAIAGSVSSQRTIAALIVHIEYLKSHIDRHETTINRAHQRIDDIERRVA